MYEKAINNSFFSVIRNVIYPSGPLTIQIGDIFFTDNGIYFFPYREATISSLVLGGITGGLIGGLIFSQHNKRAIEESIKRAEEDRTKDYGLTMEERRSKHINFLFLTKNDILNFEIDDKEQKLSIVTSNYRRDFIIENINNNYDKINKFLSGEIIFDVDLNEVGLGLTPPNVIVQFLKDKIDITSKINKDEIHEMINNDKYMKSVHSAITNNKDYKLEIYQNLLENCSNFSSILLKEFILDTKSYKVFLCIMVGLYIIPIIIILLNYKEIVLFLTEIVNKGGISAVLGFIVMFILFPVILFIFLVIPKYKRLKENKKISKQVDFKSFIMEYKQK